MPTIKVLGDLQNYAFPRDSFDLIVCYNVIEHLTAPDVAIRFFPALAPGGLLFIGAPNPQSFSGLITKLTPHWFHVGFYRFILRYEQLAKRAICPFALCHAHDVDWVLSSAWRNVVYFAEYQGEQYDCISAQRPLDGMLINAAVGTVNASENLPVLK